MSADFPGAIWVPAHPTNYRVANRQQRGDIDYIVIHETSGHAPGLPVAQMWQEPHHGSSAHFIVDQYGAIFQTVLLKDAAWHAHAANERAIGIEHCARKAGELGPTDPGLPMTEIQYCASARLVAWLLRWTGLPTTRDVVVGHSEVDKETTHAECPQCVFDFDHSMAIVRSYSITP